MTIKELNQQVQSDLNEKLKAGYVQLNTLLNELRTRQLPASMVEVINEKIDDLNTFTGTAEALRKKLGTVQTAMIKQLEKELQIVPQNHYRKLWLALGMTSFGLPMGVAIGMSLGSMAYLALGLPIGLAIGTYIGTAKDKKALEEGKQLNMEIK